MFSPRSLIYSTVPLIFALIGVGYSVPGLCVLLPVTVRTRLEGSLRGVSNLASISSRELIRLGVEGSSASVGGVTGSCKSRTSPTCLLYLPRFSRVILHLK